MNNRELYLKYYNKYNELENDILNPELSYDDIQYKLYGGFKNPFKKKNKDKKDKKDKINLCDLNERKEFKKELVNKLKNGEFDIEKCKKKKTSLFVKPLLKLFRKNIEEELQVIKEQVKGYTGMCVGLENMKKTCNVDDIIETLKKPENTRLYLFCERRFIIDVLDDKDVLECIYNEIGYVFKKFKKIKTLVTKKIDIEMVELFYEALFSILGYIYQSITNDKDIKEDKDIEEIEQDVTLLEDLLHIDRLIEGICNKEKITKILKDIQKDIKNENYRNNSNNSNYSNNDDVIMLGGDNEIIEDYYTEYIEMKSRYLDLKNEFL